MIRLAVTSDVHGEERNYRALVHELKTKNYDLVLDNGDFFYGSPEAFYYEENAIWPPILELADEVVTVAVPGNHDFTHSYETFEKARRLAKFEWICANVSGFKPYTVRNVSGVKVVILGLTTSMVREWDETGQLRDLEISSPLGALRKWISVIREEEQPDILIVSYHGGFSKDPDSGVPFHGAPTENEALAIAEAFPDIDLLITGHQHLRINSVVNGVKVIQPGSHATGYMDITINQSSEGYKVAAEFVSLSTQRTTEPTLADAWLDEVIADVAVDERFSGMLEARLQKQPFHALIHDVFVKATVAELTVFEMPYLESGGFFGPVTRRDVLRHTPHKAPLHVIELTGRDVRSLLEQGAAVFAKHPETGAVCFATELPELAPAPYVFDVWGGIDYAFDFSQPVGARLISCQVNGVDIQQGQVFRVAVNRYRLTGYDFPLYKTAKVLSVTERTIPHILLDALSGVSVT
ncbi:hypothetical protein CQS04_07310 [Chryseomicrobium excrementi]|uniref:Bifunctional metallophosphatase/5'-nucleotidase n=1 Tax=Chryseomicrobium excrementi TaxID=2041346 RepID=A0A2M9F0I9_9BACL|nr:metallophosphoesterase [Chryseomicrobium excrementi]PJK16955.1 hypothetical protein CQS04_07310 [Chryseomicrobium excrementi]